MLEPIPPRTSLADLAAVTGVSARTIRFYIARGLLPPPEGAGRGARYTPEHAERLRRIVGWQQSGHTLDGIARMLSGQAVEPPEPGRRHPALRHTASLWTRVELGPGVELHLDASLHAPTAANLLALRAAVEAALAPPSPPTPSSPATP